MDARPPHTEVLRSSPETEPKRLGEVGAPTQKPTNERVEVQDGGNQTVIASTSYI
ncbi:MAG TPA: hypothetical protein GXX31_04260 [Methanothermobacter sp.]|jgi:hypothetical protein|uniref:Uncharacterized protein n=1 Tax=Methanothermobacter tenebrarum TaxID=680118 RepID=A0ABN6PDE7_9EURY|nr:hypothetical protein [Methanothermobacter tenebrarum]MDD3454905.1 hypothetical protein [Methanobacteriales archaeon]MDX9693470.1 hypothetical protein [Methanothermobacter sp.]BDH79493.1 hypothetical protein MTTB_08720 [Methanothermobacter tenebrarum]HHW16575.1 hypothetical protein [Methanothermobacter sp.]HOQ19982.1 hypothetical protein [Methanothermobacter sp.]